MSSAAHSLTPRLVRQQELGRLGVAPVRRAGRPPPLLVRRVAQHLVLLHHVLELAFPLHQLLDFDVFVLDLDILVLNDVGQVAGEVFVSLQVRGLGADDFLQFILQLFDEFRLL